MSIQSKNNENEDPYSKAKFAAIKAFDNLSKINYFLLRISKLHNNYFFYVSKYKEAQSIAKSAAITADHAIANSIEAIKTDSKESATYAAFYADLLNVYLSEIAAMYR